MDDLVTRDWHVFGRVVSTDTGSVLVGFGTGSYRVSAPYTKLTKL